MKSKNDKQRSSLRILNGLNIIQNTSTGRMSNPIIDISSQAQKPNEKNRGSVQTAQVIDISESRNSPVRLPQPRMPERGFNIDLSNMQRNNLSGPLKILPTQKPPTNQHLLTDRGNLNSMSLISPKDHRIGAVGAAAGGGSSSSQLMITPKKIHINAFPKKSNRRSLVTAAEINSLDYLQQSEEGQTSQNAQFLVNNKDNPIYDTLDNTSNYDQRGKFIHILDEEDKKGMNALRESVFDQKKLVKGAGRVSKSRSFIEWMRVICKSQAKVVTIVLNGFKILSSKVEQKSSRFLKKPGRSEILWLIAALLISAIVFSLLSLNTSKVSDSDSFDSLKAYLARSLIGAAFLFIVYGVIFLAINNYYVYLGLFFVQAVPCLFVFASDIYKALVSKTVDHIAEPEYINAAFFFGLYFFWMTTHFVLKDFRQSFNKSARNFFMLFWCILCGCVIVGYLVYTICTTYQLDFFWGDITISALGGPYLIVIAMSWIYMHFTFFEPYLQKVSERRLANEEKQLETLKNGPSQRKQSNSYHQDHDDDQKQAFLSKDNRKKDASEDYYSETEAMNGLDTFDPRAAAQEDRHFDSSSKKGNKVFPFEGEVPVDEEKDEKKRKERQEQQKILQEQEKREKQDREIQKKFIQLKIQLTKDTTDPRIKVILENYCVHFGSVALGGSLMICCVISILNLQHDLETGKTDDIFNNPRGAYLSFFYLFAMPAFFFLGTAFVFSRASHKIKFIVFPVAGGLVPVLFFLPMSLVMDLFYQSRPLQLFLSLGPAAGSLYLVTILYIKLKSIQITMFINGYFSLFFAVPLLYILPQRKVYYFEEYDDIAEGFQWALITIGILLLLTYIIFDIFVAIRRRYRRRALKERLKKEGKKQEIEELEKNEFKENQRFDIADIFRYDLLDFGLWGNAFGYIFTLAVLAYMFFNKPVWVSPRQSGAILGMQFVIFFLFLISILALLMKIIPLQRQPAESYSERLTEISESKGERQETLNLQHRVKRAVLTFSFIYLPLFLGLFIIIFKDDDEVKVNLLTVLIGVPIVALIFLLFFKLKQNLYRQSRTAVPAIVVFCWIFIYLPLGGILPSGAIYLSNGDEDNVNYERLLVGFLVVFLLIGIALIAIFIHMYFKRKDFEKKFLFIAAKVIRRLAKIHVKSDFHVVNLMYQGYLSKGAEGIREALVKLRDPVTYAVVPDQDPDPRYSKVIVDSVALENLKNNPPQKRNQCFEKFWSLFFYYLCCCYKDPFAKKMEALNRNLYDEEGNPLLGSGQDGQLGNLLNEDLNNQRKSQDNEDLLIEEDPWMKKYLLNKKLRPFPEKIIEPLRRYDLGVQLEISKPWTDGFLKHIFHIFAQGSEKKYDGVRWVDYLMFKELLVQGGVIPCKEIEDFQIDLIYDNFTMSNGLPNKRPVLLKTLERMLRQVAKLKYPFEFNNDEAYAKLERNWLYPYLLWNIPPLRALYIHEWDYVLFLLKLYGMEDLYKEMVEEDEGYYYKMKKELGLIKDDLSDIDNLVLPDIDGRLNGRKSQCARCCDKFMKFLKKLLDDSIYFAKSMCLLKKDIDSEGQDDEMEAEVKLINKTILKPSKDKSRKRKDGKGYFHEESPEWPEIVDDVIDEIQFQENEFARKKEEEIGLIELRSNHTNRCYLFSKVIEYISIAFLAFRPAAKEWGIDGMLLSLLNILTTENPNTTFAFKFAIAAVLALAFAFVLYSSVKRIRTMRYGYCEAKKKKHYHCNPDFFQIQFSSIVGIGLYFWIFKVIFDSFSCDYAVVPKYLYQQTSLICFDGLHDSLFGLGIVIFMIFYPLVCFTWGNVQYQNRSLDVKYDTTYMVIQQQLKLILAAASAFLAYEEIQIYYFGFSACWLFIMAFMNYKMKPCQVKKINPLDSGALYICGWWHLSAFVVEVSGVPIVGVVILILGTIAITVISLLNWKILHDQDVQAAALRATNPEPEIKKPVAINDEDDNDDESEEEPQLENLNKIIYDNLEHQLTKYDPSLLKLGGAQDEEIRRKQGERMKKLEEYKRRMKILERLDREDKEDGVIPTKREPQEGDDDYIDVEDRPKKKLKTKKIKIKQPKTISANW